MVQVASPLPRDSGCRPQLEAEERVYRLVRRAELGAVEPEALLRAILAASWALEDRREAATGGPRRRRAGRRE
jgi:hypothetical protein